MVSYTSYDLCNPQPLVKCLVVIRNGG